MIHGVYILASVGKWKAGKVEKLRINLYTATDAALLLTAITALTICCQHLAFRDTGTFMLENERFTELVS